MRIIFACALLIFSVVSIASSPTCHDHPSGGYCRYIGQVDQVFMNENGYILIYFKQSISTDIPKSYDFEIKKAEAAAYRVSDNPEFSNSLFSAMLAAQLAGREVGLQMRGVVADRLRIDRFWIK